MIKVDISGFDNLQRTLEEASRALQALDGRIALIQMESSDPPEVQRAIATAKARLSSPKPKNGVIRSSLQTLASIVEKVAVPVLKSDITSDLSAIHALFQELV
jgi:hypothetical protein